MPVLSDAKIKRAPIKERAYQLADDRGLYIIVNSDGSKWWRLRYTLAGRRNILSLGVYPDTPLAVAREKSDAARKLIARGIDPVQQRKADKAAIADAGADQFEAVARAWLTKKAHDWVPAHLAKETLRLEKHAFPWIGSRPIRSLGVTDLLPLVTRVFSSGHLEQAYRLCDQLSRVFVYAVAVGRADSDPAHTLAAVLPARRKKRRLPAVSRRQLWNPRRAIPPSAVVPYSCPSSPMSSSAVGDTPSGVAKEYTVLIAASAGSPISRNRDVSQMQAAEKD